MNLPANEYHFVSVDGGVANNEPLEIARRALADASGELFNPRNPKDASRSVIMVDPFPTEPLEEFPYQGITLFKIAFKLFGALKEQARFKPEEMELAADLKIFSRYMIAPSRSGAARGEELAGASIGAFGGFFSEKFRQHDFQLGRANCQSFLLKHFYIGLNNKLVEEHKEWFRNNKCLVAKIEKEIQTEYIQVIPMVNLPDNDVTTPLVPIPYDSIAMTKESFDEIIKLIEKRISVVLNKSYLIDEFLDGIVNKIDFKPLKWLAGNIKTMFKGIVAGGLTSWASGKIQKNMEEDLNKRKLLK